MIKRTNEEEKINIPVRGNPNNIHGLFSPLPTEKNLKIKLHNLSLTLRKLQSNQTEGQFTKYLISIPQECQGHEKHGNTEK